MGLVMPCTMALYDGEGLFRGVAGVELPLDTVKHEFLDMGGRATASWLIDASPSLTGPPNNVVASSSDAPAPSVSPGAGYREEGDVLVVHYPLNTLDWTFVATLPP